MLGDFFFLSWVQIGNSTLVTQEGVKKKKKFSASWATRTKIPVTASQLQSSPDVADRKQVRIQSYFIFQ